MSSSQTEWSWRLDKYIPSSTDDGHAVIEELVHALEQSGWEGRDFFHVHMATEEAVVNAIEHGNKRDPNKTVHIDFRVSPLEVHLAITDQGEGFDPESLPDPTDEELLEKPRGRGVMLIRELMTEALYNSKGNSVVMKKVRSAASGE
ncbi:MAG: ATP-binding protein [Pirellulales bacterium]